LTAADPTISQESTAKVEALAVHATLNPHPERVNDPLFASDPFFDARDAVQVKYEMLRKVRVEGASVAEATQAFGLSRPTFYDAKAELEAGGLAGLLPLKKGPRRAHKMSDEVMAWLAESVREQPHQTPAQLARRMAAELGIHVHPRSVARALLRPAAKKA